MSIELTQNGAVAWATLNRPEAMNSLDRDTVIALTRKLAQWRDDPSVRVLAITGAGRAFCAGADLKQAGQQMPAGEKDLLDLIVILFDALRAFPKPVIAAVNGLALAGGLETVLCCDIVIASERATFGDAHSNFGVFPGGGGAAVLPRRIPPNVARYLLFTGDQISAGTAHMYGLVNEVVEPEQLILRTQALAERLAAKAPLVLAGMKRVANAAMDNSTADALRHELLECRNNSRTRDMHEGLSAFIEKRQPDFEGF